MTFYKGIKMISNSDKPENSSLNKLFLTEKEASERYGYSREWFQRQRWLKKEPKYIKVVDNGKVLYPLNETDKWFNGTGQEGK